jgi:hypothetical protein
MSDSPKVAFLHACYYGRVLTCLLAYLLQVVQAMKDPTDPKVAQGSPRDNGRHSEG